MTKSLQKIQEKFGISIENEIGIFPPEKVKEIFRFVKEEMGFDYLSFITAVDRKENLDVVYGVRNTTENLLLVLKTNLRNGDSLPSIFEFYKGADWMEREVYDLFGIKFDAHPDLRRIVLPEDWEGHPLRKSYPIDTPNPFRPAKSEKKNGT